jgi:DNA-binding CsgD family transcriptional regulator
VRVLPEATQRALLVAAASDTTSLSELLPALERLGLSDAFAAAETAGLVAIGEGRLEFDHPLIRSAVYGAATESERRRAHAVLAETAIGPYGEERSAWHRAAAAAFPDERVAAALERSAARARRRGGVSTEAEILARAAELTPDPEERSRRRLTAAQAAQLAGRLSSAVSLARLALTEADDPLDRARIRELEGTLMFWEAVPGVSWRALVESADAVESRAPDLAARLLGFAAPMARGEGLHDATAALLDRAQVLVESLGDRIEARTAVIVGTSLVLCGRESEGYALAAGRKDLLDSAGVLSEVEATLQFAILSHWVEQYDTAREVLERTIEAARAAGAAGLLPLALDTLSAVHARVGRWDEAYVASTEALHLAEATGQTGHKASFLSSLANIEALQGREAECREHAVAALAIARERRHLLNEAYALAVLGRLELALGHPEEAIRYLITLEEQVRAGPGVVEPGVIPVLPDLVEAYVRARRRADAGRLLELFSVQAARAQSMWALAATARCRGLLASDDEFEAHFREALEWHVRDQRPYELARTQLCFGERLRRARRPTEARELLQSALEIFERLGAAPWAERAARELGSGARRRRRQASAVASLSPKELQVAMMVARGATNREAAAALFLSPKTIEAHLSRAYAKLGVRSRTELAARLADDRLRRQERLDLLTIHELVPADGAKH